MHGAGHVIGASDASRLRAHYTSDRARPSSDGRADYLTSQPGAAGVFLAGGDQFSRDAVVVGAGGIVFASSQQEFVYRFHFVSVFSVTGFAGAIVDFFQHRQFRRLSDFVNTLLSDFYDLFYH